MFIAAYSRLFDLAAEDASNFDADPDLRGRVVGSLGEPGPGDESLADIVAPEPQSISLNVSASCNLACSYCYAGRGGFGGAQPRGMSGEVARAAVDRLFSVADPSRPITIGFMGGEPFVNRRLIHEMVEYATANADRLGLDVRYSVTTNATLLTPADLALLRSHPFAVTVSLDGDTETHDKQRPQLRGGKSWWRAVTAVRPLLHDPGQAKVAARSTVTRHSATLVRQFEAIIAQGFREIGFAPLRSAATSESALRDADWQNYLDQLVTLSRRELERLKDGGELRLTNFAVALKQIHRGASSPYPCGAGGGYFSVAHDGAWYACHRAIGDASFKLGDSGGLDEAKRADFLKARHVHAQTDCRTCWARYLCSGGCHHEASARSVASCDFVREWLRFCLSSYAELSEVYRHRIANRGGFDAR